MIDADTMVTSEGDRIRLPGVNAREVTQFNEQTGEWKQGQAGGDLQTALTKRVMDEQGFQTPVYDTTKDTTGTRFIGDYANLKGERLSDYQISHDLTSLGPQATAEQARLKSASRIDRYLRSQDEPQNRFELALKGEYKYKDEGDFYGDILNHYNSDLGFKAKPSAPSAKEYGMYPEAYARPAYVRPEETRTGQAISNWSTGLDSGIISTKQSFMGAINSLAPAGGDTEAWSQRKINRMAEELSELPIGKDTEAFDETTGEWKLDTAGKIWNNLVWMGASNVPQIGTAIAASALAPATFGLSLSVPLAQNAGRVWNNQPEGKKDLAWAWGTGGFVTVMDQLGLKGITGQLGTEAGKKTLVSALMAQKNITKTEAEERLLKSMGSLGEQLKLIGKAVGRGSLTEAGTETVQDLAEEYGTNLGDIKDPSKLINTLKNSAYGGFVLGSLMSAPTGVVENKQRKFDIATELGIETDKRTDKSLFVEGIKNKQLDENGRTFPKTDFELAEDASNLASQNFYKGLEASTTEADKPTLGKQLLNVVTNPRLLLAADTATDLKPFIQYEWAQKLAGLIDSPLVRGAFGGLSPYKRARQLATSTEAVLRETLQAIPVSIKEVGLQLYGALQSNKLNQLTPELNNVRNKLNEVGETFAYILSKQYNNAGLAALFATPDFFLKNRLPDPSLISSNRLSFQQLLEQYATAKNIDGTIRKVNATEAAELAEQMSKEITPNMLRELIDSGITSNPAFDEFFDNNIESNAARIIDRASKIAVKDRMFGRNGENIAALIQEGVKKGNITEEQGRKLAGNMSNYVKAFDGELNKPKSALVRGITENFNFISTLVYMDTALFGNLSELVYGSFGLKPADQKKYFGQLAKSFAGGILDTVKKAGEVATKGKYKVSDSGNKAFLRDLGYYGLTGDILLTEGVSLSSRSKRNMSKLLFKLNGVEGVTNTVRAVRGSMAKDELLDLIAIVAEGKNKNSARWARDRLEYYRMDVDKVVELYKKYGREDMFDEEIAGVDTDSDQRSKEINTLNNEFMNATINFIDEFASRPEPGSTPIIFDDHRFALFTQFKRFTAHLTSNVIPQLWSMYIKRGGTPEYTYATFSSIILTFAVAYVGLSLKDALRGEDGGDDEDKIVKALEYSWGGTLPDMWEIGKKTYKGVSGKSSASSAAKDVLAQAPGANTIFTIGKDTMKSFSENEGESTKAKDKLVEKIPFLGEMPVLRDYYATKEKK
jgi:polyhydroxyalkanoate synthesis regulator phasin